MARAVNSNGQPGLEVASNAVTVSSEEGVCLPQVTGAQGAEPFSAKLKYTGKCRVSGVGHHTGNIMYMPTFSGSYQIVSVCACVRVCVRACVCMYMHTCSHVDTYTHHTKTTHVCFK